ncbi:MAG: hypothetical protein HON98_08510 [Chloroflexi bacterium]|nr:hypothetical protein [Chloroflexota bacterium]MBT3669984.1 hypothetical protein [Chloroflexota bacterium]MBT4003003.1 hypothetical protein [Chloroflexota bacterium]MBT4306415.1 hypothetical protein [Chloroflexota bacterium]MBT4534612.1 hypothetical protein [Chloroflexota bacterium]
MKGYRGNIVGNLQNRKRKNKGISKINIMDYLTLTRNAIITILTSITLYSFFGKWMVHFQYPIIRQIRHPQKMLEKFRISFDSLSVIILLYSIVGFFILYGFAIPLIPGRTSSVNLNSLELAILGMIMVGLIRILTLLSSVNIHRTLMTGIVLSAGLVIFLALQDSDSITRSVSNVASLIPINISNPYQVVLIPFFGSLIAIIVELGWIARIYFIKRFRVSTGFVNSTQEVNSNEIIGYTQKNVRNAYLEEVEKVLEYENLWEICWLASFGENVPLYRKLIEGVEKKLANEEGSNIAIVNQRNVTNYNDRAKKLLQQNGMYLLCGHANEGKKEFLEVMGFEPGYVEYSPRIRFLIINRKVIISSWTAHTTVPVYGKNSTLYGSTMYSVSTDPVKISEQLKIFQSQWGVYLMNDTQATLNRLGKLPCWKLLNFIIERGGIWTSEDLLIRCELRNYKEFSTIEQINESLEILFSENQIIDFGENRFSRNENLFIWQYRWLKSQY